MSVDWTPPRSPVFEATIRTELDVTADRNLLFDYDHIDLACPPYTFLCFECHKALKALCVEGHNFVLHYATEEPSVIDEITSMEAKVQKTFSEFVSAVRERTDFKLEQTAVRFKQIPES